ncbi:response regulator transcription factor [Gehongia tenuis]|uniref:Stage 0 sporulation protein A homolog n=1 Tax=Gehongia tenuis TaxID=2763655 RepID=A0A926D522_9FIRM|nr:response regulator transcription factor [Gehongia tenuis]
MIDILIVEDDLHIAKMIEATLSIGGYQGHICENGRDAVERIMGEHFDLILLDVMLPDMDGFEVIQRVQNRGTPVIFLTARQEVADKVRGLRLGAEDYIVKPFEAVELLARVEVVLRRSNRGRNVLAFEDIVVNLDEHTVRKGDRLVSLTPKEFDVLVFFLQNLDIALTRERLLAAVWGYAFEGESRTVDIHVQHVRKKLGLQQKLVTVPKLGYRLES